MPFERGNYHVISTVVSSNLVSLVSQVGREKNSTLSISTLFPRVTRKKIILFKLYDFNYTRFYIHQINLIFTEVL